jgi:hypothetical protein
MPVFRSSSELVEEEETENTAERRRKIFIEDMDRSLLDAFMAIERSKKANANLAQS